jgi:hypothetical protein
MSTHAPSFPENRFAENRSPDPDDRKTRDTHDSDTLKKPRRFSRKDVEENIPADPDPDDPVSP